MPEVTADPPDSSCYHLFSQGENRGISTTCSWSILSGGDQRARPPCITKR